MVYTAGSTWNYQQVNNTPPTGTSLYTVTSTSRDSTINSKTYHVFTNSNTGASEYYNNTGADYYTFQKLPDALGGEKVENLYLKDNAALNTTWIQTYNISFSGLPLAVTTTNKIKETGITKTVNGINYTGVIHVETSISVAGIPASALTTDIQSYYAPRKGLIQNSNIVHLNYLGVVNDSNVQTNLMSATIL
ncbi:MAG: hypothetical protein ABIY51_16400 [Ferruginibacter sp.]